MKASKSGSPRQKMVRLIALILCVLLIATTIGYALMTIASAEENAPGIQLSLTVEEAAGGVHASQAVFFSNDTGGPIGEILFQIPANSLRRRTTVPSDGKRVSMLYGENGFSFGGVSISSVLVDGRKALWGVSGEGETTLHVIADLPEGARCRIQIEYDILLPASSGFLGMNGSEWRLAGCFPVLGVYDPSLETTDVMEPGPVGEWLYADETDMEISLSIPGNMTVAAGGTLSEEEEEGRKNVRILLTEARDFACVIGNGYTAASDEGLRACAPVQEEADRMLGIAKKALNVFRGWIGETPGETTAFAACDVPDGTRVYSRMVFIDRNLLRAGNGESLEREIVTGLAKQYFSIRVNNHPQREAWLGEAIPAYMTLLYYEEVYGKDRFLKELNDCCLDALNQTIPGGIGVDSNISLIASEEEYRVIMQGRGAAVLHEIRQVTGKDAFLEAIRLYYENACGKHGTIADFSAALNQAAGREMDYYLMEMLRNIGDYVNQQMEWYE